MFSIKRGKFHGWGSSGEERMNLGFYINGSIGLVQSGFGSFRSKEASSRSTHSALRVWLRFKVISLSIEMFWVLTVSIR